MRDFFRLGSVFVPLMVILPAFGVNTAIADDQHLGVSTCAGSTCHGAPSNSKKTSGVVQNEYTIWQCQDKHAKAFDVLTGDLGKRIAKNMRIDPAEFEVIKTELDNRVADKGQNADCCASKGAAGSSAGPGIVKLAAENTAVFDPKGDRTHQASGCLDCHADNATNRGEYFHISDGVGCEACHGGAARWLGPHLSRPTPSEDPTKLDVLKGYGLKATETAAERAKICLACHLGDDEHRITHEMFGAGHPRLSFELQYFTLLQPAHFLVDDTYRKRKPNAAPPVQVWAVGQAMALEQMVSGLARSKRTAGGVFPELAFFNCQACHHPVDRIERPQDVRWVKRGLTDLDPGLPRFNDANAIMLRAVADGIAPSLRQSLDGGIRALHRAISMGDSNPSEAAASLERTAAELVAALGRHTISKPDMGAMIRALAQSSHEGNSSDYAFAEQATMAFRSIVYDLKTEGEIDESQFGALNQTVRDCLKAIEVQSAYRPETFDAAAQTLAQATRSW